MKLVYSVDFCDGGRIGLFSTAKKAIEAAVLAIKQERWHVNENQVCACRRMLKDGHKHCVVNAVEAVDIHDLSRRVEINLRRIQ